MTDHTALIAEARTTVAPYRRELDSGQWVSSIGLILMVEKLADALEFQAPRQVTTVEGAEAIATAFEQMPVGQLFVETDGIGRKHRVIKVFGGLAMFDNGDHRPCIYGEVDETATILFTPEPLPESETT